MGRFDGSKFAENKRRREFLLLGIAGGAGVIALAALGISQKTTGGGGGVSLTPPKVPYASGPHVLSDSPHQYISTDPSISPTSDNTIDLGNQNLRWRALSLSGPFKGYGGVGDVNPTVKLDGGGLNFGVGGSTPTDTKISRFSAGVLQSDSDFVPSGDNSKSLGNTTTPLRWKNIAMVGTFTLRNLTITSDGNNITMDTGSDTNLFLMRGTLVPNTDNVSDIGSSSGPRRWKNIIVSGSITFSPIVLSTDGTNLTIDTSSNTSLILNKGHVVPANTNVSDLGTTNGPRYWRNAYFDGTILRYKGINTAGFGVPAIVAEGDLTGQTGTVASVCAYTVGASNGVFKVGGDVDITAFTCYLQCRGYNSTI